MQKERAAFQEPPGPEQQKKLQPDEGLALGRRKNHRSPIKAAGEASGRAQTRAGVNHPGVSGTEGFRRS